MSCAERVRRCAGFSRLSGRTTSQRTDDSAGGLLAPRCSDGGSGKEAEAADTALASECIDPPKESSLPALAPPPVPPPRGGPRPLLVVQLLAVLAAESRLPLSCPCPCPPPPPPHVGSEQQLTDSSSVSRECSRLSGSGRVSPTAPAAGAARGFIARPATAASPLLLPPPPLPPRGAPISIAPRTMAAAAMMILPPTP